MPHRSLLACGFLIASLGAALAVPVRPAPPADFSRLKQDSIKKWSGAEILVLGKFTQAIPGPVGLSQPPLYTFRLQIETGKILRGPAKLDAKLNANFSIRQLNAPVFPAPDKECLIALKFVRGAWIVQHYDDATEANIEQARLATSFPLGWTIADGKLTSPWAAVGKPGKVEGLACSVTGRPVLLAGQVRFDVESVAPPKRFEFKNPDGDGEYKLTVKNDTDEEVEVPALLTDGKTIRWDESILIRVDNKTYPVPGSTGDVSGLKAVVLKPGEAVSGTLHALTLVGPSWPRGGSRVEFQFCLAERSNTQSFYYFSNHHDPIREAVQKKVSGAK